MLHVLCLIPTRRVSGRQVRNPIKYEEWQPCHCSSCLHLRNTNYEWTEAKQMAITSIEYICIISPCVGVQHGWFIGEGFESLDVKAATSAP